MTAGWLVVILVGASSIAIKGAGPLLMGGRAVPPGIVPVFKLLAPALFGALVVTQAFARGLFPRLLLLLVDRVEATDFGGRGAFTRAELDPAT